MTPERRTKLIRKCARAMARSTGYEPDFETWPSPKVLALMNAGHLAASYRVQAWQNFLPQATEHIDSLALNVDAAPHLEAGKVKFVFHYEVTP